MSLIKEVERILGALAQEVHQEASVLVQFAAGDWFALKQAFLVETGQAEPAPAPAEETPAVEPAPAPAEDTPATVEETPVVELTVAEETPVVDKPASAGDEAISSDAADSLAKAD